MWFLVAIITVAFISVLVAWLVFLWEERTALFFIETKSFSNKINRHSLFRYQFTYICFITRIYQAEATNMMEKIIQTNLYLREETRLFTSFEGVLPVEPPQIREYHVEKLIIYGEDLFQFFSLTVCLIACT